MVNDFYDVFICDENGKEIGTELKNSEEVYDFVEKKAREGFRVSFRKTKEKKEKKKEKPCIRNHHRFRIGSR